jgi:hypothetical protein
MKLVLNTLLLLLFLSNCSEGPKENLVISAKSPVYSIDTLKMFYRNDSINISGGIHPKDPYPDSAIFFQPTLDLFAFDKDKRVINLYYDTQLKILAVSYSLNKNDTTEHYRRYDRKGLLRMEFFRKNNKDSGTDMAWHSNGKIKFKWFNKNGKHFTDTSYYFTGELEKTSIYHNSCTFKETSYYRNGKISAEMFWYIPEKDDPWDDDRHSPKFIIEYDSVNGFPKLSYMKEKEIQEKDYSYTVAYPIPVDSAEISKKTK